LIAAELAALGDVRPERAIAILERLRTLPHYARGN
jgi:hypothetical protein